MKNQKKRELEALLVKQQGLVDAAKNDGSRALTEAEAEQFDVFQRQIEELKRQIVDGDNGDGNDTSTRSAEELARQAERKRSAEITKLCREFDIQPDKYINDGTSVDAVRAAVLEQLRMSGKPLAARVTADENDKYRDAATDAIMLRSGLTIEKPASGARDMLGMSVRDLAAECLARAGVSGAARMTSDDLYAEMCRQFYNPSAAFPSIMDQVVRKSYEAGYNEVQATYPLWTSRGVLSDFKETTSGYLAGNAGELLRVEENGELQHDLPTDGRLPTRKLNTYGRQFTMTRQAFVNDDIGFLTTVPSRYAKSARRTINNQVYSILTGNPVIYDGIALFDTAAHKNVIAQGTGITSESIQKMLLKLQLQKDEFGDAVIINPAFLVVPVGYGATLYTIFNSDKVETAQNTQAANPLYKSNIRVIEDATLNALAGEDAAPWFLVADRADAKSIQVDYLNGQEIPTIRRSEKPGTLGFIWDIYLDWGVSVVDYRGIVKNPGAKLNFD